MRPLKSENEDIDVTETAIDLKSAEMTYEAALMATGKVMQTTLLNFNLEQQVMERRRYFMKINTKFLEKLRLRMTRSSLLTKVLSDSRN